jgi:hypothetical protein
MSYKIINFVAKAQTKLRSLQSDLISEFDIEGYQSDRSELLLLQITETYDFIDLISEDDYAGLSEKQVNDLIDFFSKWLDLHTVVAAEYRNFQMPIQPKMVVDQGEFATSADLSSEIDARLAADQALSQRIDTLEGNALTLGDIFPATFWDLHVADDKVVFNDDQRLHTHDNEDALNALTGDHITALNALDEHYENDQIHVSSEDRENWDNKLSTDDLTTALQDYAEADHEHTIGQVQGLSSTLQQMLSDIEEMAGADGREVELQLNGDNLEWRYVGESTWIDLGNVRGNQGDAGDPFSVDARGNSNDRFSALYDSEDENFTFLETDTGYLYFRKPTGGAATIPAGWSIGIKFVGDNGWAPMLGVTVISDTKVVLELIDWVGGTGTKPTLDAGNNPPTPVRWYLGANGFTLYHQQAINIKGPMGATGGPPVIGATGMLAELTDYDDEAYGFIFMRNDVSPQTIFIKNSNTSGDWSDEYPWQGPSGQAVSETAIQDAIDDLKDGVPSGGDTLNKLYELIVGLGQLVGDYDASGDAFPTTGTGDGGAIDKGDYWYITVSGTPPGFDTLEVGDVLFAKVDAANDASEFFRVPYASLTPDWDDTTKGKVERAIQSEAETAADGTEANRDNTRGLTARSFRWAFDAVWSYIKTQAQVFTNNLKAKQIASTRQSLAVAGAAQTIDWNNGGMVNLDTSGASGTITLTLSNPVEGSWYSIFVAHGATARDLIFPAGTIQQGELGVNYTASGNNKKDVINLFYDGTIYWMTVNPLWG